MARQLPCDWFLMGNFRWPISRTYTRRDIAAGRKFELEGMLRVIREYEAEFGIEHVDHCYETGMPDQGTEEEIVELWMQKFKLPSCFLQEYINNAVIRERCVAMDLEALRRVRRWYMTDVEE
jgi:hypothetical protein